MLGWGKLPKYGSPAETALLFMQKRKNNIEELKYHLRNKAILISNFPAEDFNKAMKEYNDLAFKLNREINREEGLKTKSFTVLALEKLNNIRNKSVKDLLKTDSIRFGNKVEDSFNLNTGKPRNWSKV